MRNALSLAGLCLTAVACGGSADQTPGGSTSPDSGTTPDAAVAECVKPVVSSALPGAQVLTFGQKTVGQPVSFNVPANTESVTIVQQAKSANLTIVYNGRTLDNSAVPAGVTVPGAGLIFNDQDPDCPAPDGGTPPGCSGWTDPATRPAYYGGGTPVTGAFTIPNTSAAISSGIPAGAWSFVVNDYANECSAAGSGCGAGASTSNTYDVSVLLKPQGTTRTLNVAFYIVGSASGLLGALTAATAPSEPKVQRMIASLTSIYAQAGITVPSPAFYDVSAADRARFGTNISVDRTGPCDELAQMFTLSSAHPGNTLNLFLVQSIGQSATDHNGTVVGIDGTIPGPSSLSGTVHSGAAVSMADLFAGTCTGSALDIARCGADSVAYVAAHEGGHFLGLFHTTEASGDFFDTLADTDKCPCLSCATAADKPKCTQSNNTAVLNATSCRSPSSCGGGENLMFWQFDNVSKGVLSADQGTIMKANALVQ